MEQLSALDYGPVAARLLADAPLNELGPGAAHSTARGELEDLTPSSVVAPCTLVDRDMGVICCAALWLRFDYLDHSHRISQAIDTPEGSFWHGVMHRREPDFFNAKYWFRRVGRHEVFGPLAHEARGLVERELASSTSALPPRSEPAKQIRYLTEQQVWDPIAFVDLCQAALDASPPLHNLCKKLQRLEWQVMFDHCYRHAITFEHG